MLCQYQTFCGHKCSLQNYLVLNPLQSHESHMCRYWPRASALPSAYPPIHDPEHYDKLCLSAIHKRMMKNDFTQNHAGFPDSKQIPSPRFSFSTSKTCTKRNRLATEIYALRMSSLAFCTSFLGFTLSLIIRLAGMETIDVQMQLLMINKCPNSAKTHFASKGRFLTKPKSHHSACHLPSRMMERILVSSSIYKRGASNDGSLKARTAPSMTRT